MGTSLQIVNDRWIRVYDSITELLARMMVEKANRNQQQFPLLHSFLVKLDSEILYGTPGCINLNLQAIADDELMVAEFGELLGLIARDVESYGTVIDGESANERWATRVVSFGEVRTQPLLSVIDAIRALVASLPISTDDDDSAWWTFGIESR
ncbi:MAG: hypothetical protein KDA54_03160 [Phycisphaerales bacterium]|nr:hypothetical protein [Phycisphaerales bacterium]